uniref:Uncharacterized protein n=1 Tax=Daphnia magna TaxID=35525 RepID=A0A0P5FLF4_9CRUS
MRLSVVCFFLPFFLGTRAMRCGSLLHVCLTLGVCLFITHLYFFFGGGAFVLLGTQHFFQKHLDVGCLTTIRYADAWHQQCTCFFSRCIKSSLSRCCVLDLVNAAFPFLGLFFFCLVFFLFFWLQTSGTRENKRVARFLTLCFTCDVIQQCVWTKSCRLSCIRCISDG